MCKWEGNEYLNAPEEQTQGNGCNRIYLALAAGNPYSHFVADLSATRLPLTFERRRFKLVTDCRVRSRGDAISCILYSSASADSGVSLGFAVDVFSVALRRDFLLSPGLVVLSVTESSLVFDDASSSSSFAGRRVLVDRARRVAFGDAFAFSSL